MTSAQLETHAHDATSARAMREDLFALYARVYADHLNDPFYTIERFAERFEGHSSRPGYQLVTGHIDENLVGYAYGVPLAANTRWWEGLQGSFPPGTVVEDGRRTFAINEIMVDERWRRRGVAHALHDTLLAGRPEQRATLLVDPGNTPARTAYLAWGWQVLGQLQPFPDAPVYEALVLDLTDE